MGLPNIQANCSCQEAPAALLARLSKESCWCSLPNLGAATVAKVLVGLVQRLLRRDHTQLKLLLLFTLIATVGFAFPRLDWVTYIGYTLVALLLTQVMVGCSNAPNWSDALY